MTEPSTILHVALAAHDAGLSVIPIRDDGSKKPALAWKQYQTERADRQQVRAWFAPGKHRAIGVVCGKVSGWLTMVEMEGWAFEAGYWHTFKDRVETELGVARWSEIVRYVELSPSGGPHIYFRCPGMEVGNLKLARGLDDDGELVVMMETRGEGGYSIIAGSEGHPSGQPWRNATGGSLEDICDVTPDELDIILEAARSLDQSPDFKETPPSLEINSPDFKISPHVEPDGVQASGSVGDGAGENPHSPAPTSPTATATSWMDQTIEEFNQSVGILGILSWLPGWTYTTTDTYNGESVHRIHRDGSDNDHGAVIFDSGRIGFFSSNCPSWADAYDGAKMATYDAFTVKMLVDHQTNDKEARVAIARELRAQGFGPPIEAGLPSVQVQANNDTVTLCPWCGKDVPPQEGPGRPRIYCSKTCRQVHHRAKREGIDVTVRELGEAQDWKCGICTGAINRDTTVRNERPSIDHIEPVSKGGGHERENLRLAHLVCNIRRGNEDYEQDFEPIDGFDIDVIETPYDPEPDDEESSPKHLRWVEDALASPPDEPELLVTGLLRRGEITVVGAPRAIGKTWASLNLATICARGEGEVFGNPQFRALAPARVLYLQGELGEWGSAVRWHLLGADNVPTKMIAESFERIRIRTTERRVTTVADGTTMSDTHIDAVVDHRLEQIIAEVSADVLVIDPWATFFAGNENSNDETEAAIIALTDIARRHNLAVWIVHHITNKTARDGNAEPEDLWRGASRLADAVSTRVTMLPYWTPAQVKEMGMDRRTARGQIRVTVLERNGPPVDMVYSELQNHWWSAWEPPNVGRPSGLNAREVVRAIEANGGKVDSQRALADLLGGKGHEAVRRVVSHLVGAGVLDTFTGPRNSVGYELTGRGLPE